MSRTFIIAEAGVNHNGSLTIAQQMISVAADAGADAIKFQTFQAEHMVSGNAPKAVYQEKTGVTGETQFEMIKKLELDAAVHRQLISCCEERGIRFLSSPFDLASIDLLYELGLDIFKIPSGEITNLPYLRKIGALRKKIIFSTGMADLGEIKAALDVLTDAGTKIGEITLLHCTTAYPVPFEEVNLRAMVTIGAEFPRVKIGYSDHTPGIEIPIAAVAMGASVIEKHFTLDRNLEGPDHQASLEPDELKAMVFAIRNIEKTFGDGIKRPSPAELKNRAVVRKSIVAACEIPRGELFTAENLAVKRPGTGISPMLWDEIIGKRASKDYTRDDLI